MLRVTHATVPLAVGVVAVLTAGLATAISVVDHSGDVLVSAGQPLSLECAVDKSWQYCEWRREGAELCNVASSEKGKVVECEDSRVSLTATDETCGIAVDGAGLDDEGEFSCQFLYSTDDPPLVSQAMAVSVAVEAGLAFGGEVAESGDSWMVRDGQEYQVECRAAGGKPEPVVEAFVGEEQLQASEVEAVENGDEPRLR